MKKGTGVYKRKESPYWWGWVTIDGKKKEFSTKKTVKTEAKKVVYAQFKRLQKGQPIDKEYKARTVKDKIKEYLDAYEHSSKKNYSDVKAIFKKPKEILGHIKITELKNKQIIKYIEQRRPEAKDGTIQLELDYTKAALRRGSNNKANISEIFKLVGVDELKPNENQHQFTHEDYLRFIQVCPAWLKIMVQIAYMFPVRSKELRELKFHKIDLTKKVIRLEKTKNNSFRNIPLEDEDLFNVVKNWCDSAKDEYGNYKREFVFVTPKRPKTIIKEATFYSHYSECARKVGIYRNGEKLTYHRLRATAAADLHRAGVPLRVIMAYGGWDSIKTVQRYIGQAEQRDLVSGAKLIGKFKRLDN